MRWAGPALIVLVAFGVYSNSVPNGFVYDDDSIILGDPRTRDATLWRDIFTRGYWYRVSTDPIYRPIPLLTYLLNHAVNGLRPAAYRVVNLALHAGVSLMVYAIAMQLFRRRLAAVASGLLFAAHPIHGEAVVIIVGRADLLCALLYLLATWLILREPLTLPSREVPRLTAILVLFALAMLTKENAVTLLAVAVLADLWRRWQTPPPPKAKKPSNRAMTWRAFLIDRFARRYLPIIAVTIGMLLIRYQVCGRMTRPPGNFGGGIENVLDTAGPAARLLTPLVLLGKYVTLLVLPHPLCYDYSYNAIPAASSLADPRVLIGLGWLALIVAAGIISWRRRRQLAWCVGFFLITYSVVSNGPILIGTLFAERAIYLPSVAWCWVIGLGLSALYDRCGAIAAWGRLAGGLCVAAAAAVLLAYAGKTIVRNTVFRDNDTLYADGVRVNPNSSPCQSAAARRFIRLGEHKTAIEHLTRALAIDDAVWYDHMLIGQEYALDGQVGRAIEHLQRGYNLASGKYRFDPAFLLGQIYLRIGRYAEAADWLRKALAIRPDHALCAANLKLALDRLGAPPR